MLTVAILQSNSAVSKRLMEFGLALKANPPFLEPTDHFVFLCGANQGPGTPSARRQAIKNFIETHGQNCRTIYAERVFSEIVSLGQRRNALDIEDIISRVADSVLIILESESAFCELGAFSHGEIRKKLILINDSAFRASESFINTGPIAAAEEAKSPVFWYPMSNTGASTLDGIGATYAHLAKAISERSPSRATRIKEDLFAFPKNKISLYFVHDLVYLFGPITHKELIAVALILGGKRSYDEISEMLGILRASDLVDRKSVAGLAVYTSKARKTLIRYDGIGTERITSTFRKFHLEASPARFDFASHY